MLRHPPVSEAFLRHLGHAEFLDWCGQGVFTVLRKRSVGVTRAPTTPFYASCLKPPDKDDYITLTINKDVVLTEPATVSEPLKHTDTVYAHCLHGVVAKECMVRRTDSPNRGKMFFTCALHPACKFFRWKDDLVKGVFSDVSVSSGTEGHPVTSKAYTLSRLQQVAAWYTTAQGSPEWLKLRFGRITASNFGTITGTNTYSSPDDYLRSLLCETCFDGVAMRWGSINEHVASRLFQEFIADQVGADSVLVEDRGIWIPADLPYVGGSPDGIVYQVECIEEANDEFEVLRCSRCLLEIKTPWKVRDRKVGEPFYPRIEVPSDSGRYGCISAYYYDQINGNCGLMGLKGTYFVVLTRSGFQVTYVPFEEVYWSEMLRPKLERFYSDRVQPSQEVQLNGALETGMVPVSRLTKRSHCTT